MNIFIVSPGRTATTTFAEAFSIVDGYTSNHESNVKELGNKRIDYPDNHFECDNRLVWFMRKLTEKYSSNSILVALDRDHEEIAKSYNERWGKILIMKSYSQGILLRDLDENNIEVCRDYVEHCYEEINHYSSKWDNFIRIDMKNPDDGINNLLKIIGKEKHSEAVIDYIKNTRSNTNKSKRRNKLDSLVFNIKCLAWDLFR